MGTSNSLTLSRRSALVGIVSAATGCASPTGPNANPTKVLFVCQAGTVKSAIAREELRRLAATRGIAVLVESRGISPEDHVSPGLGQSLKVNRIDVRRETIRRLTTADLAASDVIVVFNP